MVESLKLTVLVDDSASPARRNLTKARRGLSVNVEAKAEGKRFSFLVDTGSSSRTVIRNAEALRADLKETKAVFLTHGHYDHTGGLIRILKHAKKRLPVVAHPRVFEPKLKLKPFLTDIGSPFSQSKVEASGGLVLLCRNPVSLMKDVSTTGEIERVTTYEKVSGFWTISRERFMEDALIDDQALVIKVEGKGLVIVSGCAHAGIVNTIMHSKKVMGVEKVYALVGGFHLVNADKERIRLTVEELLQVDPEIVSPCHCTGRKAISAIKKAFGERYRPLKTGDIIEL